MNLHLDVVITDGASPSAGHRPGAGGARRDAGAANDPEAPMDLRQKALRLAGR
jgi:thymidine phosphorylase